MVMISWLCVGFRAGHSGPGSQVPIYFLAETLGLRFEKISYHFEGISMFRCCFSVNRKVGDAPVEPFDVWVECSLKA